MRAAIKSQHGFKSEIFLKRHGKVYLREEHEVTATTQDRVAAELKRTGGYKRVCCWSHRYSGRGIGGSPIATRFFVLAFA